MTGGIVGERKGGGIGKGVLEHWYFQQLKSGFESVISIFCCSVSVGNISLHFQTFILPLIVIIQ